MIAVLLYIVALFFIGIGNAVATYHILRYRDPDDLSGIILILYYALVLAILIGTAISVDWMELFSRGF